MLCEFFEFFRGHGAVFGGVEILAVHAAERLSRRPDEDDDVKHTFAGHTRLIRLAGEIAAYVLPLLFVRLDAGHEFFVQVQQAEREGDHDPAALFVDVAHLDARAADVDDRGAVERRIRAVGDEVAVGFLPPVDGVDGDARTAEHRRADFFEIPDGAQRGRRDKQKLVGAQPGTFFLHRRHGGDDLFDAAGGKVAPVQIVQQREVGAVFENDLRLFPAGLRDDHGNARRADVYDGISHTSFSFICRGRRRYLRRRGRSRCRDRRACICLRCPAGH